MKIEFESEKEREVFIGECGATLVLCKSIVRFLQGKLAAAVVEPTINNATACLMACGFTFEETKQVLEAETDMEAFKVLGIDRFVAAAELAKSGAN